MRDGGVYQNRSLVLLHFCQDQLEGFDFQQLSVVRNRDTSPAWQALKVSEEAFRQAVSAKQATTLAADEAYSVSRDVFFQLLQPLHHTHFQAEYDDAERADIAVMRVRRKRWERAHWKREHKAPYERVHFYLRTWSLHPEEQINFRRKFRTSDTLDLALLELLHVRSDLRLQQNLHFYTFRDSRGFEKASWGTKLATVPRVGPEIILYLFADRDGYLFHNSNVYGNIGSDIDHAKVIVKHRGGIVKVCQADDPVDDQVVYHERGTLHFMNFRNVQNMARLSRKVLSHSRHDFVRGSGTIDKIKAQWPNIIVPTKEADDEI